MALVDYSGSESDSDDDEKATIPKPAKTKPTSTKPTFQKVVDRSNPNKIKVSLPEPVRANKEDEDDVIGPPAKRAKTGSGGISGFNSFLPAPKRTTAPNGGPGPGGIRKGGLGSGISLKTGAVPGFSREPEPNMDESSGWNESTEGGSVVESPVPSAAHSSADRKTDVAVSEMDTQPKKKSTMFKPLSVANKKAQKKRVPFADSLHKPESAEGVILQKTNAKPKASLFSAGDLADEVSSDGLTTKRTYEPTIYYADNPTSTPEDNTSQDPTTADSTYTQNHSTQPQTQSLHAIATDLNLSASAKRQLLGRHHNSSTHKPTHPARPPIPPTIVNFNTDEEYAANELLRQAGETVQHNPVRGIAPGKHSLKQLVNAASNQKDALEEQFASGWRNKKEAGSKYGW